MANTTTRMVSIRPHAEDLRDHKLCKLIDDGYQIISATTCQDKIVYVLTKAKSRQIKMFNNQ